MGMTKSPAVEIPADHLEEVDDLQERNGKKRTSVDQEEGEGSCIVCRFVLGHPWRWFLVSFFSFSFHLIFLLNPHLWLHSRFIFDVLTPLYLHNCHGSGQLWVWTCWASAALFNSFFLLNPLLIFGFILVSFSIFLPLFNSKIVMAQVHSGCEPVGHLQPLPDVPLRLSGGE